MPEQCQCMKEAKAGKRRTFPMAADRRYLHHIVVGEDDGAEAVFGKGVTQEEALEALRKGPEVYCLGCGLGREE